MWRKKPGGGLTRYIQEATTTKKKAFKKWQQSKDDEDNEVYKVTKKECKKAVAVANMQNYTKARHCRRK